jgi:arylsulfatase A-like enzyme
MTDDLPNIVLVVFDTARRDRFGCYGYDRATTPMVDSLAADGLQIETMISNAPWTLPAHGSLFTGLYPSEHGCQWRTGNRLNARVGLTLAEWLRDLGYTTVCATNNGLISRQTGLARGFDRYAFRLDVEHGRRRAARRFKKALFGGDSGGLIMNRWIGQQMSTMRRPWFLFVNYLECHWAYAPPGRFAKAVGGPRYSYLRGLRYRLELAARVGPWEAVARADEDDLSVYSTLYDGELRNADAHLEQLVDALSGKGLLDEDALMIVTSDHGEHIGEHGLADHHASIDEHLVRVPFVAWSPSRIRSQRRQGLWEFVDVLPSLARFLGHELPTEAPGRRTDLFLGSVSNRDHEYAFAEWRSWNEGELARLARRNPNYDFDGLARDLLSIRDQRFKLVRSSLPSQALYDLEVDPMEEIDVSSIHAETAARLSRQLDAAVDSWVHPDSEDQLDEGERLEIEQRLTELGYI